MKGIPSRVKSKQSTQKYNSYYATQKYTAQQKQLEMIGKVVGGMVHSYEYHFWRVWVWVEITVRWVEIANLCLFFCDFENSLYRIVILTSCSSQNTSCR